MTGESSKQRILLLGALAFLVTQALLALSFAQLFYEPLPLWCRIGDQVLLVIGLLGSTLKSNPLRFAGWVGICIFIPYVLIGSIPSLDHPAFDANGEQRPEVWIWRLALSLALSVSLIVCFRKLAAKSR
jgi:hypothetical protein